MDAIANQVCGRNEARKPKLAKDVQNVRIATQRLAEDSVSAARQTAAELVSEGRQQARNLTSTALSRVRSKQFRSIALAAATGLVAGMLIARRR